MRILSSAHIKWGVDEGDVYFLITVCFIFNISPGLFKFPTDKLKITACVCVFKANQLISAWGIRIFVDIFAN